MAQSGYTPLSLYYSATATNAPLAANLVAGELALNTADGKLFYKDSSGVVQVIASKAGNVNVSSFSGGTTGLTPNTATSGAVTLAGTLAQANGGTGFSTYTTGDTLYASASNTLSKLPIGSTGQILSVVAGVPAWTTATSGALTVGTTTVTSGTSGYVLYNNAGTLGNLATTGTDNIVLATSPTITTPVINKINTSVANTSLGAGNASIMKNRIINGAMVIDQRNAGASVTANDGTYAVDRFRFTMSASSKGTGQQQTSVIPVGFSNALKFTSSAATSLGSTDFYCLEQYIEGYNVADLNFGTANAKTFTLSAWVYSSLTGTFGGSVQNSASDRSYPFTYSIPVANTWTQISVTIAGDTSGTWLTTNGIGMKVCFGLGCGTSRSGTAGAWASTWYASATGATSVVGTNGATFYITGVQLEVGSSATGYEYVNYQTSLANCQRYYYKWIPTSSASYASTTNTITVTATYGPVKMPVTMRTTPTLTTSGTATDYGGYAGAVNFTSNSVPTMDTSNADTPLVAWYSSSLFTIGVPAITGSKSVNGFLGFNAEL